MKEPRSTPWGKADDVAELYEGIFSVKTASHGGIMIHSSLHPQLSEYARSGQACISFGEFLAFEEDCNWAVAAFELNLFPHLQSQVLETLCSWHPEYASESVVKERLTDDMLKILEKGLSRKSSGSLRERLKAERSSALVVSAAKLDGVSDIERCFRIQVVDSVKRNIDAVAALRMLGEVVDEAAIIEGLDGDRKLCAVWTADDRIHIVDNYPGYRTEVTLLANCGNTLFSSN